MWPATYRPLLDPLPIWVNPWIWPLLLLPLCAAVSIVYKAIRCRNMAELPREAAILFFTITLGMFFAAMALAGLGKVLE